MTKHLALAGLAAIAAGPVFAAPIDGTWKAVRTYTVLPGGKSMRMVEQDRKHGTTTTVTFRKAG